MNDAFAPRTGCHSRSRNARRASETERMEAGGKIERKKARDEQKRMDSKYIRTCDGERGDRHASFRSSANRSRMDAGRAFHPTRTGTGRYHGNTDNELQVRQCVFTYDASPRISAPLFIVSDSQLAGRHFFSTFRRREISEYL